MQIFQIISHFFYFWFLQKFYECGAGCYDSLYEIIIFVLLSFSGLLWLVAPFIGNFSFIFVISVIIFCFSVIFDFLTLSFISSKNQKFLQKNPERIPHNTFFIIYFLLWRIFLPDIFLASSLMAYFARINLSKKWIFLIAILAQIIRISLLFMVYFLFV